MPPKGKKGAATKQKSSSKKSAKPSSSKPSTHLEKHGSNQRKPRHNKEDEPDDEEENIRSSLREKGLDLYDVTGDGNCLFRALSHQLFGSEIYHHDLRAQVMKYVREHEDEFRPFLEDDEPWESYDPYRYVRRMSKEGQWAGNIELVAAGQLFQARIIVHQDGNIWKLECGNEREIHLVYMCGEHYDSVKKIEDNLAAKDEDTSNSQDSNSKPTSEEKMIMSSTGCTSLAKVRRLLGEMQQDSNEVIGHLLADNEENDSFTEEVSEPKTHSDDTKVDAKTLFEFAKAKGVKGAGPSGKLSNKQKRRLAKQIENEGFRPPTTAKRLEVDLAKDFRTLSI